MGAVRDNDLASGRKSVFSDNVGPNATSLISARALFFVPIVGAVAAAGGCYSKVSLALHKIGLCLTPFIIPSQYLTLPEFSKPRENVQGVFPLQKSPLKKAVTVPPWPVEDLSLRGLVVILWGS